MPIAIKRQFAAALALGLGLTLTACGGMPSNPTLYSVKQPVVERANFVFDVQTGPGGLSVPEQQRLTGWFETMELGYGDRVAIDDPMQSVATREAVARIAGRYGVLLSEVAPVTQGTLHPSHTRVVITRSTAYVPGCPDWSASSDSNYSNGTSPGYGCAVNGNMAAMVANPEDLISGQKGSGQTIVSTSNKAISSHRDKKPTGEGQLKTNSTGGG